MGGLGTITEKPVADSIGAEVRGTRPNSSFVGSGELNLSPQDKSTATVNFPVATLGVVTPDSPGISNLIIPKDPMFNRMLTFPALVGSKTLIKIKYRSEWQNKAVSGGSRRAPKPPGYHGYRGRQISFTAMLNASDRRTTGWWSIAQTIETLRLWSKLEITRAIKDATKDYLTIKIRDDADPRSMRTAYKMAMAAIQGEGEFSDEPNQAARVEKMAAKWDYIETAEIVTTNSKVARTEFTLNNPVAMFPLSFRFGILRMSPCVIKKAEINVLRYSEGTPRSIDVAKVSFVLQEILNEATIWADTETPSNIISNLFVHKSGYPDNVMWSKHGDFEIVSDDSGLLSER